MNPLHEQGAIENIFGSELGPGERLLWTGRPAQGLLFRSTDIVLCPFTLAWCAFAFFWEASVLRDFLGHASNSKAPFGIQIFNVALGSLACMYGLYIVFGRFYYDIIRRRNTYYAITNDRIIIISKIFKRSVTTYYLNGLPFLNMEEEKNGRGNILLDEKLSSFSHAWQSGLSFKGPRMLEGISNVKNVYDILQKARRAAFHQ